MTYIAEKGKHEKKAHTQHANTEEKGGDYAIPLAIALTVLVAASIYFVSQSNAAIDGKIKYAADLAKPASLIITKISAECPDCFDVTGIVAALKQLNANITESDIALASPEATQLVSKYNISRIPTIIVSGETEKAGLSAAAWSSVGTQESDGALVLRIGAPFMNPASGEVLGKAEVILLNYSACAGCYDVALHNKILKGFGVVISSEKTVDSNSAEGKALVQKYNITKVPTVLISPDAKYYASLEPVWVQVGTIEKDGWYVFRNMAAISGIVYYDLSLNKTINQTA